MLRTVVAALSIVVSAAAGGTDPPVAVRGCYRGGTVHVDRRGAILREYDPDRSFFPIGIWGVPEPRVLDGVDYRWEQLATAGFNTVWPWPYDVTRELDDAAAAGLQTVMMRRVGEERLALIHDHPALLGIVWMDEPLGRDGDPEARLAEFAAYREMANRAAPGVPVFVNNTAWIDHPLWDRWQAAGAIACHDNYPVWPVTRSLALGSFGTAANGIDASVARAVRIAEGRRPVWLIVQAFESVDPPDARFPFRHPTPRQLRAMVYAGVVHGATGICYFTWDSWVSRAGRVIGMSADPRGRPRPKSITVADPIQRIAARALWDTAARINRELAECAPALLSATAEAGVLRAIDIDGAPVTATPVRALVKRDPAGGYLAIVVNLDNSILGAVLRFCAPVDSIEPRFVPGEAPELRGDRRSVRLTLEPFDTRIYRVRISAPGG